MLAGLVHLFCLNVSQDLCSPPEMVTCLLFFQTVMMQYISVYGVSVHCPVGSVTVNGSCNHLIDSRKMFKMTEQQEHCNQMGMTLFIAKTRAELNETLDLVWEIFRSFTIFQPKKELSILYDYYWNVRRPFIYLSDGHALLSNDVLDYKTTLNSKPHQTQVIIRKDDQEYFLDVLDEEDYESQVVLCQKQPHSYCIHNFTYLNMQERHWHLSYDCIQECLNQNHSVSFHLKDMQAAFQRDFHFQFTLMRQNDEKMKRFCQCWSSETDFFSLNNIMPGSCDNRDFTNEQRKEEGSGINVYDNHQILTPLESCWDAEFYSIVMSINATIQHVHQNTFVIVPLISELLFSKTLFSSGEMSISKS